MRPVRRIRSERRLLALAVGAACVGFTANAFAVTMLATPESLEYSVEAYAEASGGSANTGGPIVKTSDEGQISTSANSNSPGNYGSGNANGNADWQGYTYASAGGTASSWGEYRMEATYRNETTAEADYFLDYLVDGGELAVYSYQAPEVGEFLEVSYSVTILVNGSNAWENAATLRLDEADGQTFTQDAGDPLFTYNPSSGYQGFYNIKTLVSLSLGTLDPGEALTVEFLLRSEAMASVGTYPCGEQGEYTCSAGNAYAGFESTPYSYPPYTSLTSLTVSRTINVPEPATGFLMAPLAAGLLFRRRARRASGDSA